MSANLRSITEGKKLSPAQILRLELQHLERAQTELEDMQTQISVLAGVVGNVIDEFSNVLQQLESEDK